MNIKRFAFGMICAALGCWYTDADLCALIKWGQANKLEQLLRPENVNVIECVNPIINY